MDVVIVGAGDVGIYIANILSKKGNNITLIDNDKIKLDKAVKNLDIKQIEDKVKDKLKNKLKGLIN